jgi:hypothetical protein
MAKKIWVGTDTGNEGDWATAANWSPSGVPASADDVYLEDSSQDVTEGFDQSAKALATLNIDQSYTGKIGDATSYLQIGAVKVNIGYHNGPDAPLGSPRIKLDLGSVTAATVVIENAGTSADSNKPPIRIKAANAATTIEVRKGKVGIAFNTGETTTIGTLTVSYVSQVNMDADVYVGAGVTLTTINHKGGDLYVSCGATTINSYAGLLYTIGSGAITTLNAKGGYITANSTGTITTLNITKGTADFLKSAAARTVTTLKLEAGGVLKYDPNILTITNNVDSDNAVILTATAA